MNWVDFNKYLKQWREESINHAYGEAHVGLVLSLLHVPTRKPP